MFFKLEKAIHKNRIKLSYIHLISFLFIMMWIIISFYVETADKIKIKYDDLLMLEKYNTNIQYVVKTYGDLENAEIIDDSMQDINKLLSNLKLDKKYLNSTEMLLENWNKLKLLLVEEIQDKVEIQNISNNYYKISNDLSSNIQNDINQLETVKKILTSLLIFIIPISFSGMIYIYLNMNLHIVRLENLSGFESFDLKYGLSNRSKCLEIIKSNTFISNDTSNVMMFFNIKCLSRINGNCDKYVTQELYKQFIDILKKAAISMVMLDDVIIGKWNKNEFMVYFEKSYGQDSADLFFKVVDELISEFNENHGGYKIKYNFGCTVNTLEKQFSVKQLFEVAMDKLFYDMKLNTFKIEQYQIQMYEPIVGDEEAIFPNIIYKREMNKVIRKMQKRYLSFAFIILLVAFVMALFERVG